MESLGGLDPDLAASLADRFVNRFLAAWPEGQMTEAAVRADLVIGVEEIDGGPGLVVKSYGGRTVTGWDGTAEDAERIIDAVADHDAFDAEGDRWIAGDGWREYRP